MYDLKELLVEMFERGATDLHITTGSPPQLRIDGKLVPMDMAPLTAADTRRLCYSVLTETQRKRFEEENELDFSFGIKNLSRFRGKFQSERSRSRGLSNHSLQNLDAPGTGSSPSRGRTDL